MNLWVPVYTKAHPDVQITTASTGSGAGISQAVAGVVQIGASDAYMSDAQLAQGKMLNIPLAISAQQINYNVPELSGVHLNLSGPVLAGIYDGSIRSWDDAKIKDLNAQNASKLPHPAIIPLHRADGSGDTTVSWPAVPNGTGQNGNPGMVQACQATKYSIASIGVRFLGQTNEAGTIDQLGSRRHHLGIRDIVHHGTPRASPRIRHAGFRPTRSMTADMPAWRTPSLSSAS
jgi:phosphate transport system substrate-binding protein